MYTISAECFRKALQEQKIMDFQPLVMDFFHGHIYHGLISAEYFEYFRGTFSRQVDNSSFQG